MVDADLVLGNALARQGIQFLMESGILTEMKQRLLDRLAAGNPDEPTETMVLRIREYRTSLGFVNSLIDVGESIKSEGELK